MLVCQVVCCQAISPCSALSMLGSLSSLCSVILLSSSHSYKAPPCYSPSSLECPTLNACACQARMLHAPKLARLVNIQR